MVDKIDLRINNKNILLSEFPADFIINTVVGMLGSLKGVDEIKTVEIKIEKN